MTGERGGLAALVFSPRDLPPSDQHDMMQETLPKAETEGSRDASDGQVPARDGARDKRTRPNPSEGSGESGVSGPTRPRRKPNPEEEKGDPITTTIPCWGAWEDWATREKIPLFVTAGRGMGGFVQRELGMLIASPGPEGNKSCFSRFSSNGEMSSVLAAGDVQVTDGKIFFSLPLSSASNLVQIVGQLMCAERAFLWSDQHKPS